MRNISFILCFLWFSHLQLFGADPTPLAIGSTAPDFALPGTDGKTYSLKDFAASKVLVIIFTCNHCPTAQAYEDRIKQLVTDYKAKGVAVVAISPNDPLAVTLGEMGYTDVGDSFEEMKIRASDKAFNFPAENSAHELRTVVLELPCSEISGPVRSRSRSGFDIQNLVLIGRPRVQTSPNPRQTPRHSKKLRPARRKPSAIQTF